MVDQVEGRDVLVDGREVREAKAILDLDPRAVKELVAARRGAKSLPKMRPLRNGKFWVFVGTREEMKITAFLY